MDGDSKDGFFTVPKMAVLGGKSEQVAVLVASVSSCGLLEETVGMGELESFPRGCQGKGKAKGKKPKEGEASQSKNRMLRPH